jgi:GxxExxY protein
MTQMIADGSAGRAGERDQETHAIIGAAMEVHTQLGAGFLEAVYHEALAIELESRGIPHRREAELLVTYKGAQIACGYRADFVCFEQIIVELKATRALTTADESQLMNYLKATGLKRGLLLNFGAPRLEYKRMVRGWTSSGQPTRHLRPSASSAERKENVP